MQLKSLLILNYELIYELKFSSEIEYDKGWENNWSLIYRERTATLAFEGHVNRKKNRITNTF